MNRLVNKLKHNERRANRVRSVIRGTSSRPRLSIHISNLHVSAQIIDDTKHITIASVSTAGQKAVKGSMTERAAWVGAEVAKKAKAKKVKTVAFDRGPKLYHGRVKALAEAARKEGLEF
jgi:large subunit ribosomal protein L18